MSQINSDEQRRSGRIRTPIGTGMESGSAPGTAEIPVDGSRLAYGVGVINTHPAGGKQPALNIPSDPLVGRAEIREFFGISDSTVNRWISAGCPHLRLTSSLVKFHLSQVYAWRVEVTERETARKAAA